MDFLFNYVYLFLKRYLGVHRHIPAEGRSLIGMIALYDFTFALSSVFINVYLFKDKGELTVPCLFNLASYATIMLAFWVGGHLSKRWSHLLAYQLGLVFSALVFLAVLLLREGSASHPWFLGFLQGLGIGFYYLGQHSLILDLTPSKGRDYFLSVSMFLSSIFRILGPALAGWTIEAFRPSTPLSGLAGNSSTGYYLVFGAAFLIYVGLILRSLGFKTKKAGEGFYFWEVLTFKGNKNWNRLMWVQFLLGLRGGVFWFLIAILVYRVSRNEAVVGSYNMISNFLAVLTAYGLSRWAGEEQRRGGIMAASALIFAACAVLGWQVSYFSLLVYAVLNTLGTTWFQVVFNAHSYDVVEKAREAENRKLEYLAVRELPLAVGRILGLSVFLLGQVRFGEAGLRAGLFILGFVQMTIFRVLPKWDPRNNRKYGIYRSVGRRNRVRLSLGGARKNPSIILYGIITFSFLPGGRSWDLSIGLKNNRNRLFI